jgi:hypothetical protein
MTLTAAAALGAGAPPAGAVSVPAGGAAWGSTNVFHGAGCTSLAHGVDCTVHASSEQPAGPLAGERCQAATAAVAVPGGTTVAFRCHVEFAASLALTGTPLAQQAEAAGAAVRIESGACAGLTVLGARIDVHDGLMGDYVVHPTLTVTPAGWVFRGTVVSFSQAPYHAVVLNAGGTILPACKRVGARRGETTVTFNGVFTGAYSFA